MDWVISKPDSIRVEYRNGKRFRRTKFKGGNLVIPASPCRVELHLPASIPAKDGASHDIYYESSIPYNTEKGVVIYYGVTVIEWKERLAEVTRNHVLALIPLEPDKTKINKAVIAVARLAIANLASSTERMVETPVGAGFDPGWPLKIKQGRMSKLLKSLLWLFEYTGGNVYIDSEYHVDPSSEYLAESLMLSVQRTLEEALA